MAAEGKRLYKQLTVAAVPVEIRRDDVAYLAITPDTPRRISDTIHIPSPIDAVVLKSKINPDRVLHPASFELTPVEFSNLLGGKVSANSALATFNAHDLKELPNGDVDIVVITQAGERRCKVGANDRARLFR